jgi:hypothetical protein
LRQAAHIASDATLRQASKDFALYEAFTSSGTGRSSFLMATAPHPQEKNNTFLPGVVMLAMRTSNRIALSHTWGVASKPSVRVTHV